jgi:hypothetical protein
MINFSLNTCWRLIPTIISENRLVQAVFHLVAGQGSDATRTQPVQTATKFNLTFPANTVNFPTFFESWQAGEKVAIL